jgi:hypothetical protein
MSLWQFQFKQWLLCPRVILRCRISTGSDFIGGEALMIDQAFAEILPQDIIYHLKFNTNLHIFTIHGF